MVSYDKSKGVTVGHFEIFCNKVKTDLTDIREKLTTFATDEKVEEMFDEVFNELKSIKVSLTGTNTISITNGEPSTNNYTVVVKGIYDDGTQKTLANTDYTLEWNSYDDNGIKFENGTLSIGSITVAGEYSIPITVKAIKDKYSDTTTITVNVTISTPKPAETKFTININGSDAGEVSFNDLVSKVRDGSVITDYGWNSKIILPYTDPVDGKEYECPFNFGTYQEFEKEDGTKFIGLGLVAEYGMPTGNIMFDNKEPSNNSDSKRKSGNNRWMYSNLRQWLNKSGKNWYTKQHSADTAPTIPKPTNVNGFLDCLPAEFVDACITAKNSTKTHSVDGGGYDTTYDKFFPLSMSQANMKFTGSSGLNYESEGRYWEYWRNKQGGTDYWSGTEGGREDLAANDARIIYNIENHSSACYWWLRSACLGESNCVRIVYPSGSGCAHAVTYIDIIRVAPACVIG